MVSKLRTHKRFSFHVRMKRSANPIPFGRSHEARGTLNPEERDRLLDIVSQVVRAVVVAQTQPIGDPVAEGAEAFADTLANRLQGLKPGATLGRMETDALGRNSDRRPRRRRPPPRRPAPWTSCPSPTSRWGPPW